MKKNCPIFSFWGRGRGRGRGRGAGRDCIFQHFITFHNSLQNFRQIYAKLYQILSNVIGFCSEMYYCVVQKSPKAIQVRSYAQGLMGSLMHGVLCVANFARVTDSLMHVLCVVLCMASTGLQPKTLPQNTKPHFRLHIVKLHKTVVE